MIRVACSLMLVALLLLLLMLWRTEAKTAIAFFFVAQSAAVASVALYLVYGWRHPEGSRSGDD